VKYSFERKYCSKCEHRMLYKGVLNVYVCKQSEVKLRQRSKRDLEFDYIIIDVDFLEEREYRDILDAIYNLMTCNKKNISMCELVIKCPHTKKLQLLSRLKQI